MRRIFLKDALDEIMREEGVEENAGYVCDIVIPFIGFHTRMRIKDNDFEFIFPEGKIVIKEDEYYREYKEVFYRGNTFRIFDDFYSMNALKEGLVKPDANLWTPYHHRRIRAKQDNGIDSLYKTYFLKHDKEDI